MNTKQEKEKFYLNFPSLFREQSKQSAMMSSPTKWSSIVPAEKNIFKSFCINKKSNYLENKMILSYIQTDNNYVRGKKYSAYHIRPASCLFQHSQFQEARLQVCLTGTLWAAHTPEDSSSYKYWMGDQTIKTQTKANAFSTHT